MIPTDLPEGSVIIREGSEFLTVKAVSKDIMILKSEWKVKSNIPIIEIGVRGRDTDGKTSTVTVHIWYRSRITQLLDLIDIPIRDFYKRMKSNPDAVIPVLRKALDAHEDDIYFKSSRHVSEYNQEERWFVHAITTDKHVSIPHSYIEKKIKTFFQGCEIVREEYQKTPVWHVHLRDWSLKDADKKVIDKLAAFVVISGGRNIKKKRIKVIPMVKVGSCDNTIRAVEYIEINHTKEWEKRFDEALGSARDMLTKVKEVLKIAATIQMTDKEMESLVRQHVSTLKFRTEGKHEMVVNAIMNRIRGTGGRTAWDMLQAFTYVGSYPEEVGVEDVTTEYAQEQLQAMGYRAIEGIARRTDS